jgi:sugar lactone lactonase YvrE
VSKFLDANDKDSAARARSGQVSGVVYLYTLDHGFSEVPGTQLSGANGVLVSPDRKWLYVTAWGSQQIHRVPLSGQGESAVVKVDFSPDNLRWAPDGTMFVTGQFLTTENRDSLHGWATVRLDPRTMRVTPVLREPGYAEFDNGTSTVQIGRNLWVGTFRGDRVAYLPAP